MLKFKKAFDFKIISLLIAGLFLLNSTAYGIDLSSEAHLRTHSLSNSEEGKERLEDGVTAMLNLKGLTPRQHGLLNQALGTFFVSLNEVREGIHVLSEDELAKIDPNSNLRELQDLKVYRFTREHLIKALKDKGASQKDIGYITVNLISHPGRFRDEKGTARATNLFILDEHYRLLSQLHDILKAQWARHERAHLEDITRSEEEIQAAYPLNAVVEALGDRIRVAKEKKAPRDTTTEAESERLLTTAMIFGSEDAIVGMEKEGQASFVGSDTLPTDFGYSDYNVKEILEVAGVKFYGAVEDDPLFQYVELPDGWKKIPTEHDMWSDLVDEKGRRRAEIFYKAAFYDRSAHINLVGRFRVKIDFERQDKEKIAVAQVIDSDGNKVIHTTDPITFESEESSYESTDKTEKAAITWLNDNYPDWKNPGAYWEKDFIGPGAAAVAEFKDDSALREEASKALSEEYAIFELNGRILGKGQYGSRLLTALLDLDWLELPFAQREGRYDNAPIKIYDFTLNEEKINIVAFSGDYAERQTEDFIKDVSNLEPNQKAVIIAENYSQEQSLKNKSEIRGKLGKKIFVIRLRKGSQAEQQWIRLLGDRNSFDFKLMKVDDIIANKELLLQV